MRANWLLGFCTLGLSAFLVVTVQAQQATQQDPPDAPSANSVHAQVDSAVVEGTVVSTTRHSFVVRSDSNQYQLFTYDADNVPTRVVKTGARVRVEGSSPDDDGTQVAENVTVIQPASDASASTESSSPAPAGSPAASGSAAPGGQTANGGSAGQAAPPPPQVRRVTDEIERDARRWHGGGRIGVGFSPELFVFGLQSQIGPIFHPRVLFRPNAEFGFGELTDMFAVNLEGAYRLSTRYHGRWTPYVGAGPSLNFIHRGASSGDVSFSDFSYKTGFNVFVGGQRNRTFVEMKTSLWSGQAPVLRLFLGYNF